MADEKAAPAPNKGLIAGIVGVVAIVVIAIVCICIFGGKSIVGKWTLTDLVDKDYKSPEGMTEEIRASYKDAMKFEFKGDKKCIASSKNEDGEYQSIDKCTYDDKKIKVDDSEEEEYELKDGALYIKMDEGTYLKFEREK